jgi:hypothetical protein
VRSAAIAACRRLGAQLRADVAYVLGDGSPASEAEHHGAVAAASTAVGALHDAFFATPFRPTGLSTTARSVVRLVDELRWLHDIVGESAPPRSRGSRPGEAACAVRSAAATVLERAAELLDAPSRSPDDLRAALTDLRDRLDELERVATTDLPVTAAGMLEVVSSLDPSFRAQEASYIVSQIGQNIDLAAAAERRSWVDRLFGRQPAGIAGGLSAAQERAGAHVERHSVWLRNSLRGAIGLGLAVLVADLSSVQHGFWVVLATLSVLRSNALSTGQSVLRGLLGTTAGFVVGGALVAIVGTNTALLWVLLPLAILFAGLAPAAISFAVGQAAFTLTLVIVFNILQPAGWSLGLVRIEDVALGSAVSLAVGLLLWPRGAAAALRVALAEAYVASASYMARAVQFGMSRCDFSAPASEAVAAAAASRRLDDTFRGYLAERGAKPMPLGEVTSLVTGVAGLRLAGDAVLDLWDEGNEADGDRELARREILASADRMTGWYREFAAGLLGRGTMPEPLGRDGPSDARLLEAVRQELESGHGQTAAASAVRTIWTGDHLDATRRLQASLVAPAQTTVLSTTLP